MLSTECNTERRVWETGRVSFFCVGYGSYGICAAEMAGGCEGVIRRIGIFVRRDARLLPPVQRMARVCPPLHFWVAITADLREAAAECAKANAIWINHRP